jgi:hypothetical protein
MFAVASVAGGAPKITFKFDKANVPGALQTFTYGVSNAAAQVGQYQGKNLWHGYILNGKSLSNLTTPKLH